MSGRGRIAASADITVRLEGSTSPGTNVITWSTGRASSRNVGDGPAVEHGMALVEFTLSEVVPLSAADAWKKLVDWEGHGDWIPMTKVDVDPTDPNRFVAYSGMKPFVLEDRMYADRVELDGDTGRAHVHKLGPILIGEAELLVTPGLSDDTAVVVWRESVRMKYLPGFVAPVAAWVGKTLFAASLRRMAR